MIPETNNIRRALVLGTGGLRGAYYTGFHGALRHFGLHFDTIAGASAGALAGAWMVANMHSEEIESWREFGKYKVAPHPLFETGHLKTVDACIQLTTIKFIDPERLRTSPVSFYVTASEWLEDGEYANRTFHIQSLPDNATVELVLRASAYLPVVNGIKSAISINGKRYRDAGLTQRIPISVINPDEYDEIWVILCSPSSRKEWHEIENGIDYGYKIRGLTPSRDLPIGRMSGDLTKIEATINIGYEDGLEFIGKYREAVMSEVP
jgi:predicted acylesterase/phospholipase RssA